MTDAITDFEKVATLHIALGRPAMLPAVIADFADLTGVSVERITGFARYGHLTGEFVPAFASSQRLAA